jgi:stage II sporulation protein D
MTWLKRNLFKQTIHDSMKEYVKESPENDGAPDQAADQIPLDPSKIPEADYPSDETIAQAFSELTAPAIPELPPQPLKTQAKGFLKQRPWMLLPLLGIFPAIAWATLPHTPNAETANNPKPTNALTIASPGLPVPNQPLSATPLPKFATANLTVATPPPLIPVDPSKLTPEQKALNARAKAVFESTNAPVDAYIEMHVSIGKGASIAFASNTSLSLSDDKGSKLGTLTATNAHTASLSGGGLSIGSQGFPANVFVEPEPGGLLYLNNRPYRGKLLLSSDGSKVHAVSYINLRHYLYSVVASEVSPSWSPEAIKAQAVAARSYALTYYFKPANSRYHLGSDEYFQVYSGTQKEDDRSNQAVDLTSGEYVSYKGGVVESLYAASDDIVAEAFAGKGMSQLGAKNLAEKGYKYDQILANYYPTTKVGKIAKDY